ncbi:MAG: LamG domain-containing protein [Sedimentisphaerales bacterium]|nr:LamG domain-containing protein [Sedimentisphaerales bacterium]
MPSRNKSLVCVVYISIVLYSLAWGFTAGPEPDLVGWWRLDEGSGNIAYDSSGNGNDGTINGTPVWVEGKLGGALQFNGIDCYIDCGNGPSFQIQSQITMACWLKTPGFTRNWAAIITKGDTAWRLSRSSETGNSIHMGINGTVTSGMPWFDASKPVTDNEWHHVAGVYDGKEARIYIDGVVSARYTASGQIAANDNNVYIGENHGASGRLYTGILDDVRIYRRGLTTEQIQDHHEGVCRPDRI